MNMVELLESTSDGAFAVDTSLEIVYWNRAAQEILGFDKSATIGYPCYQVLQGLDEGHRPFCKALCRVAKSVSKREPVASYDIQALTKKGERKWLNMSVVTYREEHEEGNTFIIHFFRDSTNSKDIEALFDKMLKVARNGNNLSLASTSTGETKPSFDELTPREREILSYLAKGYGTREIAQALFISPNTVRNHIQHILQKLHVHRRAEAVAYAIRFGLVE